MGRVQKHGKYFRFIITIQPHLEYFYNLIYKNIVLAKVIARLNLCYKAKEEVDVNCVPISFFTNA
jgi:hypothetical protein